MVHMSTKPDPRDEEDDEVRAAIAALQPKPSGMVLRCIPAAEIERLTTERQEFRDECESLGNGLDDANREIAHLRRMLASEARGGALLIAQNESLRHLLAECFPLVRPGTDLSRRLRKALG
jgi:hypothetical protein